ncbi:MAG: ThiF family adenylyltransferase [Thermoplasmata archaeon]
MGEAITTDFLERDRYDRMKRIPWIKMDSIKEVQILIVGAGALGNEVVKDMILAGFAEMSLVDMDHVAKSNLNRCVFFREGDSERRRFKAEVVAERAMELNPRAKVAPHTTRIQDMPEDFISCHSIVLGCLDNVAARLHLNAHCCDDGIPYIDGAMDGLIGKVQVVYPPETPCLQCAMNKTHARIMDLRFSCTGEDVTFFEPKIAAEITTTSVVSAVQVREAMKIASGAKAAVLQNIFYYDGFRNVAETLEVARNPDCPHHGNER